MMTRNIGRVGDPKPRRPTPAHTATRTAEAHLLERAADSNLCWHRWCAGSGCC